MINDEWVSLSSEDSEEVKEYGDNVSVEDDGTENVIIDLDFISLSSHNKLGVKEEIEAEYYDSNTANDHVSNSILSSSDTEYKDEQCCHAKSESND